MFPQSNPQLPTPNEQRMNTELSEATPSTHSYTAAYSSYHSRGAQVLAEFTAMIVNYFWNADLSASFTTQKEAAKRRFDESMRDVFEPPSDLDFLPSSSSSPLKKKMGKGTRMQRQMEAPKNLVPFVLKILSATRLSTSVVLLSICFIKGLTEAVRSMENRQMMFGRRIELFFLIALMLGNKIMDDNTFTHNTWSGLSNNQFTSSQLTTTELAWLKAVNFSLHVDEKLFEGWKKFWEGHLVAFEQSMVPSKVRALEIEGTTTAGRMYGSSSPRRRRRERQQRSLRSTRTHRPERKISKEDEKYVQPFMEDGDLDGDASDKIQEWDYRNPNPMSHQSQQEQLSSFMMTSQTTSMIAIPTLQQPIPIHPVPNLLQHQEEVEEKFTNENNKRNLVACDGPPSKRRMVSSLNSSPIFAFRPPSPQAASSFNNPIYTSSTSASTLYPYLEWQSSSLTRPFSAQVPPSYISQNPAPFTSVDPNLYRQPAAPVPSGPTQMFHIEYYTLAAGSHNPRGHLVSHDAAVVNAQYPLPPSTVPTGNFDFYAPMPPAMFVEPTLMPESVSVPMSSTSGAYFHEGANEREMKNLGQSHVSHPNMETKSHQNINSSFPYQDASVSNLMYIDHRLPLTNSSATLLPHHLSYVSPMEHYQEQYAKLMARTIIDDGYNLPTVSCSSSSSSPYPTYPQISPQNFYASSSSPFGAVPSNQASPYATTVDQSSPYANVNPSLSSPFTTNVDRCSPCSFGAVNNTRSWLHDFQAMNLSGGRKSSDAFLNTDGAMSSNSSDNGCGTTTVDLGMGLVALGNACWGRTPNGSWTLRDEESVKQHCQYSQSQATWNEPSWISEPQQIKRRPLDQMPSSSTIVQSTVGHGGSNQSTSQVSSQQHYHLPSIHYASPYIFTPQSQPFQKHSSSDQSLLYHVPTWDSSPNTFYGYESYQ